MNKFFAIPASFVPAALAAIVISSAAPVAAKTDCVQGVPIPICANRYLTLESDSKVITITIEPVTTTPTLLMWGVENLPTQTVVFNGDGFFTTTRLGGAGTIHVASPVSYEVFTTLAPLGSGWYRLPELGVTPPPTTTDQVTATLLADGSVVTLSLSSPVTAPFGGRWGVNGTPVFSFAGGPAVFTASRQSGAGSVWIGNQNGVAITTSLRALGSGWYELPAAVQPPVEADKNVTITASATTVTFTVATMDTVNREVLWGVSPAVTSTVVFSKPIVVLAAPSGAHTFHFYAPDRVVTTTLPVDKNWWFTLPAAPEPVRYTFFIPLIVR